MPPHNPVVQSFPVLPTINMVVLPGVETSLDVGRTATVYAIDAAERADGQVLIIPQRDADVLVPTPSSHFQIGNG